MQVEWKVDVMIYLCDYDCKWWRGREKYKWELNDKRLVIVDSDRSCTDKQSADDARVLNNPVFPDKVSVDCYCYCYCYSIVVGERR